jgi:methionine synthase II (cobalamin-independent)
MPRSEQLQPRDSAAIASGLGSMPGSSALEAIEVVAGELSDLPFLPELPARGPGADMIGRTAGLVARVAADLSIEPIPSGWRLCGSQTRATRQAQSWLSEDLDQAEERFGGSQGAFKVQIAGPWTLAAAIETAGTALALADSGLVAELGQALAIAAGDHIAEVSRRLPGRAISLQVDEPSLSLVLQGGIRTASGFGKYAPVSDQASAIPLSRLVESSGASQHVLHSCGAFPFEAAKLAGFDAISLDLLRLRGKGLSDPEEVDAALATQVEAGVKLFAGVVPTSVSMSSRPEEITETGWRAIDSLWRRTGLDRLGLRDLVVTPTCGLAGSTWPQTRAALTISLEIARRLSDD